MLETIFQGILRLFAFLLRLLAEWWTWGGETETEQRFFYRTGCVVVPILSLGLLNVERDDNTQLLDWRTISIDSGEFIGQLFWIIIVLPLLAGIWSYLGDKA